MIDYYDKDGSRLSLLAWGKKLEEHDYKRVDESILDDGTWISTVWLGLNHQYGDGPPLIFETMVFPSKDNLDEQDMERYSTLEEAKKGHEEMVLKWQPA